MKVPINLKPVLGFPGCNTPSLCLPLTLNFDVNFSAVECAPPLQIQNGFLEATSNSTVFGTKVKYTCESGFKILGPSVLTCLASGQYDAVPPSCIGEFCVVFGGFDGNRVIFVELPKTVTTPVSVTKATKSGATARIRTRPTRIPTTIIADTEIVKLSTKQSTVAAATTTTTEPPSSVTTTHSPQIIVAGHPQDNEISGSANIQHGETPNVNVPLSIDGERRETYGAKLNLGAIIALGAFGGLIFLAAIITTIVILVRR